MLNVCFRSRNQWAEWASEKMLTPFFKYKWMSPILPPELKNIWIYNKLIRKIKYDVWPMFNQFGCDKIYEVMLTLFY